jgi:hypothetical protein
LTSLDNGDARNYGWAAIALADGSLNAMWQATANSTTPNSAAYTAIPVIPDVALRAAAYDRLTNFLSMNVSSLRGPDHVVGAVQRDAIRALISTRQDPKAIFATLSGMITRGEQVPAAAEALNSLPRQAWPTDLTASTAKALIAWAEQAQPAERTGRDYVGAIQVADQLAGVLPSDEADSMRQTIAGLRVPVFVVRAVVEELRFDTPRLVVPTGKPFEIIFDNPDVMPHNFVVVKPQTRVTVGTAAMSMMPEDRDARGRAFVPNSEDVIAATRTLESGQTESLRVPRIRTEGIYEYVCTFPGHWTVMYGQLVVTNDVDAYLKSNPLPTVAPVPTENHAHGK